MSELSVAYPKDSVVIIQMLSAFTGGKTVDVSANVNEHIRAGSIITDDAGTLGVLESAKAETAAATGDSILQVYKGHNMVVGAAVKGGTITSIDTSNDGYDILNCSGTFGVAIALDEDIVNDGANAIGIVITTKMVRENGTVDVGVMYRGEVNEAAMEAPIDSNVKTALKWVEFTTD